MAKVSIGLPVFNGEKYVAKAIQSVLSQTFEDWELVISDNDSADATESICRGFANVDSRIQYSRSSRNNGAAWNFNEVFHRSHGEYFRWLSHDDFLMPKAIERSVEVLAQEPDVVACSTATGALDKEGYRILDNCDGNIDLRCQGLSKESETDRRTLIGQSNASDRYRGVLLYSRRCNEIYSLVRRSVMARTQLHPTYCGGEKVLLAELALSGPIFEIPELLFFVRWHEERFTSNSSTREQDLHMATEQQNQFRLPHQYRSTVGYLALLRRRELSIPQKLKCLAAWFRLIGQASKWSTLLYNTLNGISTSAQIAEDTKRGARIHDENGNVVKDQPSYSAQAYRSKLTEVN